MVTQEHLDQHRLRKLGCAAEAAVDRVDVARESRGRLVKQRRCELADRERHRGAVQKIADLGGRFLDVGGSFRKGVGDRAQHAPEGWHPETIAWRKVGAGKKWRAVR